MSRLAQLTGLHGRDQFDCSRRGDFAAGSAPRSPNALRAVAPAASWHRDLLKCVKSALFVGSHEPRVARHVNCDDDRKPSLRTRFGHYLLQTTNGTSNASQLSLERPRATEHTLLQDSRADFRNWHIRAERAYQRFSRYVGLSRHRPTSDTRIAAIGTARVDQKLFLRANLISSD